MKKSRTFWLSYDLGLRGDYSSLYRWLDKNHAKECGNSVAVFPFDCSTDNPKEEIKNDLLQNVEFGKTDRVYLVWRDDVKEVNYGVFIIGNRKPAPWEGYFATETEQVLDT